MVSCDAACFTDFEGATSAEFVLTNGSGTYASSTICGACTRRYHALLAAPTEAGGATTVFLSSLEETLTVGGARAFLSTAEYPGAVYPDGYRHISSFRQNGGDVEIVYEVSGVRISKRIVVVPDEPAVVVTYELFNGEGEVELEVRPLSSFRDRHKLTRSDKSAMIIADEGASWVSLAPYKDLPPLHMHTDGDFFHEPRWYKSVRYRCDRERGHDFEEDLLSPGFFSFALKAKKPVSFIAFAGNGKKSIRRIEAAAAKNVTSQAKTKTAMPALAATLAAGMDDFVTLDEESASIVRGLPWHIDWARNAMMATAGLLATSQIATAGKVLATWAARGGDGLLPAYDAPDAPGDVEATLWLFEAAFVYLTYTGNYEWAEERLFPRMRSALEAIEGGACREAEWREDGLLYTDGSSRFLAPVEGRRAFVEIQALFFNAFKVMEFVETHFRRGQRAHACHESAKRVQRAFNELMWSGEHHVGVDSLHEGGADLTPRPMSLLAVSLSHPVLVRRRWDLLLDTVEGALLTPLGLRGKPFDVGAKAYFPGDSFEDARRHGGIWPQFLGAYLVAYAKTFGRSDEGIAKIESHLEPLQRAAETGMLNHLPEFFDSAEPFTQRGAPADAAASGQLIWALTAKIETYHFGGEEE